MMNLTCIWLFEVFFDPYLYFHEGMCIKKINKKLNSEENTKWKVINQMGKSKAQTSYTISLIKPCFIAS